MIKLVWPIRARSSRQGLRQDLSKGGHTMSYRGYLPDYLIDLHDVFWVEGGGVMGTPQPPLATPLVDPILDA